MVCTQLLPWMRYVSYELGMCWKGQVWKRVVNIAIVFIIIIIIIIIIVIIIIIFFFLWNTVRVSVSSLHSPAQFFWGYPSPQGTERE